ncbi:MAG: carboxypeptidase regulatory-like domain-containing protein [Myxococcales bacterium]|nr:carboxypeptidase regulatory-like domain-containing protein [Myxococcales bacterium]
MRASHPVFAVVTFLALALVLGVPRGARADGDAVLKGVVVDAKTRKPIEEGLVTVRGGGLVGERTISLDKGGTYRIPQLPPGTYELVAEASGYETFTRTVQARSKLTTAVNIELKKK